MIWIGAWGGGVTRLDPASLSFKNWNNSEEKRLFSNNNILSIYNDSSYLWLGTFGGGLNRFDKNTGEVKYYTESDGLCNNVIYGILGDEQGNIWMSTNNGLSKFNPETEEFRNFDVTDGLQSNEFYWGAACARADGSLVFGGINGFNIFHPSDIRDNPFIPPIVLTDFKIYNKAVGIGEDSVLQRQISYTEQLDLTWKHNVISFEFAALNYIVPEKNQYAYILEGFDNSWNYIGTNNSVSYTNLDPGDYTFRVKGSNNDGLWNEEGVNLQVTIIPPFWKTWWFYGIIVVLVGSSVYLFIKYRERALKREKDELEKKISDAVEEVEKQKSELIEEKEKVELNNWINHGFALFSDVLSRDKNDLKVFCQNVLKALIDYVHCQMGAIFVYYEEEEKFVRYAAYAYGKKNDKSSNRQLGKGEGIIGAVFESGEKKILEDIPDDYLNIQSGLGETRPQVVLFLPLKYEEIKLGVVELASVKKWEPHEIEFMEKVCESITSSIFTVQVNDKANKLLEQSKLQEEQLKENEEELRQNLEELQATQEDAKRKILELERLLKQTREEKKELKKELKSLQKA
jgi:hypothetical protein